MTLRAEIILEWGGGEHLFRLGGKEIEELEYVCGKVGFGTIYQRLMLGTWFWGDLHHVIRLGLIGGGLGAVEAKRLVDMYVGPEVRDTTKPLASGPNNPESIARAVLGATMHGFEDLPKGDDSGEAKSRGVPASTE